jgi:hypothetical protein
MQIFQSVFDGDLWEKAPSRNEATQWVLLFGSRKIAANKEFKAQIKEAYPNACVMGCTTSGEIVSDRIYDHAMIVTAITLEHGSLETKLLNINEYDDSSALGQAAISSLTKEKLRHVFVLSDGHSINGSDLVAGIKSEVPEGVSVSGGLAGDDDRFEETLVWFNDHIGTGLVAIVGLYGESLSFGCGHLGGWRAFGPKRVITKSHANIVYEIDGQPALSLYKEFLGDYANGLPASALRYPLSLHYDDNQGEVVRTILSINEDDNSMVFAGNVGEGLEVRLMHASYENLLDGAEGALELAKASLGKNVPQLSLLVSCVGRRLVLGQRSEEELEVIRDSLPDDCVTTGFYSYGEISPIQVTGKAALHNQTMTITLISEKG